jgi:hypothetical protein
MLDINPGTPRDRVRFGHRHQHHLPEVAALPDERSSWSIAVGVPGLGDLHTSQEEVRLRRV